MRVFHRFVAATILQALLFAGVAAGPAGAEEDEANPPPAAEGGKPEAPPTGMLSINLTAENGAGEDERLPAGFSEAALVGIIAPKVARDENPGDGEERAAAVAKVVKETYEAIDKDPAFAKLPCALAPGLAGQMKPPCHYYLYVPEDYKGDRDYPALLMLHGGGGNLRCAVYLAVQSARRQGMIVVCPTYRNGEWWTEEGSAFALKALADAAGRYRIDPKAVGIAGVSNGAIGAWVISEKCKDKFAAVVSIAGAFNGSMPVAAGKGPPVYIVHGADDGIIPPKFSREAYAVLKEREGTVFRELPDAGHLIALTHAKEINDGFCEWLGKTLKNGAAEKEAPAP